MYRMMKSNISRFALAAACLIFTLQLTAVGQDNGRGNQTRSKSFIAFATGGKEPPTPRFTPAEAIGTFTLNREGTELSYRVTASNIRNVVGMHIHFGGVAINGPIMIDLLANGQSLTFTNSGVVAQGVIKAAGNDINNDGTIDFEFRATPTGSLTPRFTFDDLIRSIRNDDAYLNLHTNDGVDPANTGPGDFPGGEVRGHIVDNAPSKGRDFGRGR